MNFRKLIKYPLFLSMFIFSACEKENLTLSDEPHASIKGSLSSMNDINGNSVINRSGVKVSLRGTDRSSITDQFGAYEIKDIPEGNYVLDAQKEGYGRVVFPAGSGSSGISLFAVPTENAASISINGANYYSYTATITLANSNFYGTAYVQILFSPNPNINITDLDKPLNCSMSRIVPVNFSGGVGASSSFSSLSSNIGQTMYYKAYLTNIQVYTSYGYTSVIFYNTAVSAGSSEKSILVQ
jgi:hypothetical protein